VFLAVVDPGVGSRRKVIMVQTEDYYFIAPDNGILSPILAKYPPIDKCEVTETAYFLPEVSFTFEARDRMAPAAAWLASGVPLKKFGIVLSDYERLELSEPAKREQGIEGEILYADKFGNLITNIPESWLDDYIEEDRSELKLTTGEGAISYKRNYAEAGKGELLFLPGSLGLIEIAAREGSASERLCLPPGTAVWIRKKA
jgi:hypothetical protein